MPAERRKMESVASIAEANDGYTKRRGHSRTSVESE